MKKFLPYILILTIIVQILAPFGFGIGGKNFESKKAEANFTGCNSLEDYKNAFKDSTISFNGSIVNPDTKNTSIDLHIKLDTGFGIDEDATPMWRCTDFPNQSGIPFTNSAKKFDEKDFILVFKDKKSNKTGYYNVTIDLLGSHMGERMDSGGIKSVEKDQSVGTATNPLISVSGLDKFEPDTEYVVSLYYQAFAGNLIGESSPADNQGEDILGDGDPDYFPIKSIEFSTATTEQGFNGQTGSGEIKEIEGESSILPECRIDFYNTVGGCFGHLIYWALFRPAAYIFGLTGKLLDISIMYSIGDESYRSTFVTEGWQLIRDFCNLFFIFVLLYIAIGTILKLHGVKTQEMIINVVIIGLFINFSLFVTQVVIDSSNIMARVFYSDNSIVLKDSGKEVGRGEAGEIRLSEAITSKVNPVELLTAASRIDIGKTGTDNEISAGTFIIVILLAIFVCIVGIIAFLSSSIIFITRIIGLWLAMILSPLAFFSYIIPKMQEVEMIGWKRWWPDTLKMSFLAPIFVFFMYIIVKFLDKGLGLSGIDNLKQKDSLLFVIGIVLPFVAIMILLMKAKSIASKMSGELGQSITKGIAAVGGVALGAGALGLAALARGTIGATAKYVQNDNARDKDKKLGSNVKDIWSKTKWYNPIGLLGAAGKTLKATGKAGAAWSAEGVHKIPTLKKDSAGNRMKLGQVMQEDEKGFSEKRHSQHTLDDMSGKKFQGAKYSELSEPEALKVRTAVNTEELARSMTGTGLDNIKDDVLKNYIKNTAQAYTIGGENGHLNGSYTNPDGQTITGTVEHSAKEMVVFAKASTELGEFSMALRRGTYDLRNISKLTTSSKGFAKFGVGLAATLATGVRMGLKGSGIDHGTGTGKGNFAKDLGTIISDSLKNIKVDVKVDHGGGGHGKASGGHSAGGHH